MNEQLIVKNFGPIKDATVDFKKVTVFIGPTGGGKSTLAKLAAIFRNNEFYYRPSLESEDVFFNNYSIGKYFTKDHAISWTHNQNSLIIENKKINFNETLAKAFNDFNNKYTDEKIAEIGMQMLKISKENNISYEQFRLTDEFTKIFNQFYTTKILPEIYKSIITPSTPIYIPSERTFLSAIEYSWAGLLRDDIGLSNSILEFANLFSIARRDVNKLNISFLNAEYIHQDGQDFIKIPNSEKLFRLYETASGIQSVVPLLVLLEHLAQQHEQAHNFIVEEPELNLYPVAQQDLLNWLVRMCVSSKNDFTITTHSPYILSHLNLLLYAYQVAEKHPDRADDVARIVPRESWINPKEFACYQVENGGVQSLVDENLGLIDNNELDALSGDAADAFDNLIRLSKSVAVK